MDVLQQFTQILCGSFDNAAQFREMQEKGEAAFPYARHVNTPCNGKIRGLPQGFEGVFVVEESYYTVNGRTHASPHLFLFTQQGRDVKLMPLTSCRRAVTKRALPLRRWARWSSAPCSPRGNLRQPCTPAAAVCGRAGSTSMFTPGAEIYAVRAFFQRNAGGVGDNGDERKAHLRV